MSYRPFADADGLQPRRQSGDGTVWVHVRSSAPVEKGSDDAHEPLLPSSRVSSSSHIYSAETGKSRVCCNTPDVPGCNIG